MWRYVSACGYVHVRAGVQGSHRHSIPWSRSYRHLWAASFGVLGTDLRPYVGAGNMSQVLQKSRGCSPPLFHLSSSLLSFLETEEPISFYWSCSFCVLNLISRHFSFRGKYWDRILFRSPGRSWTHDFPMSASWVSRLKAPSATPSYWTGSF